VVASRSRLSCRRKYSCWLLHTTPCSTRRLNHRPRDGRRVYVALKSWGERAWVVEKETSFQVDRFGGVVQFGQQTMLFHQSQELTNSNSRYRSSVVKEILHVCVRYSNNRTIPPHRVAAEATRRHRGDPTAEHLTVFELSSSSDRYER